MREIVSIFLISMMLLINVGLIVSSHCCGEKVADSCNPITQNAVECGMDSDSCCCDEHDGSMNKKDCCENEYIQLTIDDFEYAETATVPVIDLSFLVVFTTSLHNTFTMTSVNQTEFLAYSPPLLFYGLAVVNQVFRL